MQYKVKQFCTRCIMYQPLNPKRCTALTVWVQYCVLDARRNQVLLSSPLPVEYVALAPLFPSAYVVQKVLRVAASR
jgi:hypothetical protein